MAGGRTKIYQDIAVWAMQIWNEAMLYGQEQVHGIINRKDLGCAEEFSALAMCQGTSLCKGDLCLDRQGTESYDGSL